MSSGASTLRNAVKRVTHKERGQLKSRSKLGLLEKKKDYQVRAKDFHKKQDYLRKLRKKAAEKNPDEFYFKMHNSELRKGKHKDLNEGGKALDVDTVKLMKTQDLNYIHHRKSEDDRKAAKLRQSLHMIGDRKSRSHKIFVDNEQEIKKFDAIKHFETAPELMDRSYNRIRLKDLEDVVAAEDEGRGTGAALPTGKRLKRALEKKEKSYRELEQRRKRSETLGKAAAELTMKRHLMGKGTKRKIVVDVEPGSSDKGAEGQVVYKWKRQRSR